MIGYFVSDQQSAFYQSEIFTKVLKFVQFNSAICTMKEKETKQGLRLLLTFNAINSVDKALEALQRI
jgi:transcription-repair coupling factor (superfamily II helicase)